MPATRIQSPWSGKEGFVILLAFIGLIAVFTYGHMTLIKHTIGYEAYLGHGPRLPPSLLLTSQWLKAIAILVAIGWLALKRKHLGWEALGLRPCRRVWFVWAIVIPLLALPLLVVLAKTLVYALPDFARFAGSRYSWHDGPPALMLALVLTTTLVTPVVEEMFFRGFLFRWLAARRPLWVAVAVSSAMFGASHLVPAQVIVATLMSLGLLWLFLKSGSLWPCIVCHIVNNSIGVALGLAATAGVLPGMLTPPAG